MLLKVLADDITGAQDTAGRLAQRGLRTYVALKLRSAPPACHAVVASLETRLLGPGQARRASRWGWLRALRGAAAAYRFQKIDSTLRGWPGPETLGHLEALGPSFILFCPAYPRQGRQVLAGRVRVHGRPLLATEYASDPLSPSQAERPLRCFPPGLAAEISLASLRQGAGRSRAALSRALAGGARVLCLDAEHEADLQAGVKAALALGCRDFVGASALADSLAQELKGRHALPRPRLPRKRLILAGSLSQTTAAQLSCLEEALPGSCRTLSRGEILSGRVTLGPGMGKLKALKSLAGREELPALRREAKKLGWGPAALAEKALSTLVRAGLKLGGRPHATLWFLTGGHTLRVFQSALGLQGAWAWGEPYAGAPLFKGVDARGRAVWMLSKPGGFGKRDLFLRFVNEQ